MIDIRVNVNPAKGEPYLGVAHLDAFNALVAAGRAAAPGCGVVIDAELQTAVDFTTNDTAKAFNLIETCRGFLPEIRRRITASQSKGKPEVFAAAWVPLGLKTDRLTDGVDVRRREPLPGIAYPLVACPTCKARDFDAIPDPYPVNPKQLAENQDIFSANNAIVVVRSHLRSLIDVAFGSQIKWGRVVLDEDGQCKPTEDFGWFRPRAYIGDSYASEVIQRCPVCQRPQKYKSDLSINGDVVYLFPNVDSKASIGIVGHPPYFIGRKPAVMPRGGRIAVSGKCLQRLHEHHVRGLIWPEYGPYLCEPARLDQPFKE